MSNVFHINRRSNAGALYYREVMVFASGVPAVIALLTLITLIKKNLGEARQGMTRMKAVIYRFGIVSHTKQTFSSLFIIGPFIKENKPRPT